MKFILSSRALFVLGIAILVLTNVVVLAGVAANRTGDHKAKVILSDRELSVPYDYQKENSGLALKLKWRVLGKEREDGYYYGWRTPPWLDRDKLIALGFDNNEMDISDKKYRKQRRPLPKQVFVVLEFNGPAHEKSIEIAKRQLEKVKNRLPVAGKEKKHENDLKQARKRVDSERTKESRLFAVDAGLDADALRQEYDDRYRYIIAPGIVKASYRYNKKTREPYGYIQKLGVEKIHVPLSLRKQFNGFAKKGKPGKNEPFAAELAWGRRFEPWILSVQSLSH